MREENKKYIEKDSYESFSIFKEEVEEVRKMEKEKMMLDIPIVSVTENSRVHEYTRFHSSTGIPFYAPPEYKNRNIKININEFLLLPISCNNFHKNIKKYFFGYRLLIAVSGENTSRLSEDSMIAVFQSRIEYEITRIRFYPHEGNIVINKSYDAMHPTQDVILEGDEDGVIDRMHRAITNIIDNLCAFYYNRRI